MSTHVMNICAKFHSNHSTKYGNIVSCETMLNENGRTDNPKTLRLLLLSKA